MRSTLRFLIILALLAAVATTALAAGAEISGTDKIYLRAGPGSEQPAIGVLSAGDHVDILDIEGSWTKIQTEDGKVGFIYHRYVTPRIDETSATAQGNPPPPAARPTAPSATKTSVTAAPAAAPGAPAPLATRAPVAPPQGAAPPLSSAGEKAPSAELSAELAALRTELAELKEKIQQRQSELDGGPAIALGSPPNDPLAAVGESTPPASTAPLSARDQSIGVLAIALFSLVIGWVLGSAFGRRGPRSHRGGRLRF